MAIPYGPSNFALTAGPPSPPKPPRLPSVAPAIVVTTPVDMLMRRMRFAL